MGPVAENRSSCATAVLPKRRYKLLSSLSLCETILTSENFEKIVLKDIDFSITQPCCVSEKQYKTP